MTMAIMAGVIYLVALAQVSGGRTVTKLLGVSASSESFTELYFAAPATLPSLGPLIVNVSNISFVIANEEHKKMTYDWSIGIPQTRWVHHGRTTVGAGQRETLTAPVVVNCPPPRKGKVVRVRVQAWLTAPAESIGYWDACDD